MTTTKRTDPILKLTNQDVQDIEDWRQLDAEIKKLTDQRNAIVSRLRSRVDAVGAHICVHRRQTLLELSETRRRILDAKRLRLEKPEVAEEYTKESVSHQLHYVA